MFKKIIIACFLFSFVDHAKEEHKFELIWVSLRASNAKRLRRLLVNLQKCQYRDIFHARYELFERRASASFANEWWRQYHSRSRDIEWSNRWNLLDRWWWRDREKRDESEAIVHVNFWKWDLLECLTYDKDVDVDDAIVDAYYQLLAFVRI